MGGACMLCGGTCQRYTKKSYTHEENKAAWNTSPDGFCVPRCQTLLNRRWTDCTDEEGPKKNQDYYCAKKVKPTFSNITKWMATGYSRTNVVPSHHKADPKTGVCRCKT